MSEKEIIWNVEYHAWFKIAQILEMQISSENKLSLLHRRTICCLPAFQKNQNSLDFFRKLHFSTVYNNIKITKMMLKNQEN